FSILLSLCVDGIIALNIFEGSVNKNKLILFLHDQLAPKLTPFLGPCSIVIMDICAIHHDDKVHEII
ncbi:hypothetical protein PAXRUDRAFT_98956, partial [Paxillus rubicundulus Ve08.2h10]